jgi:hypothetical protein
MEVIQARQEFAIPYHHNTNAKVERVIRTCRDYLSKLTSGGRLDWPSLLPFAVSAYNTSLNRSVGNTPYYLFHGQDLELEYSDALNKRSILYSETNEPADCVKRYWHVALQEAERMSARTHSFNKTQLDKRIREHKMKIGDIVYKRVHAKKTKAEDNYAGPFRLMELLGGTRAQIKPLRGKKLTEVKTDDLKKVADHIEDNVND